MSNNDKTIVISGHSDDLIEVDGDLSKEFDYLPDEENDVHFLSFSDGTLLSIQYTKDGFWRLHVKQEGKSTCTKVEGTDVDENYSDKITLVGNIEWVRYVDSSGNSLEEDDDSDEESPQTDKPNAFVVIGNTDNVDTSYENVEKLYEKQEKSKLITSLTPEQEARIEEIREEICQIAFDGRRIDEAILKDGIQKAYTLIGKECPPIVIVDSPDAAYKRLEGRGLHTRMYGSQDLYWIAFYEFCRELGVVYDEELNKKLDIISQISRQCEWWWAFDDLCVVSQKPIEVHWDDNQQLHGEHGPSVRYADGFSLYTWHGVSIPQEWIETPESLTAEVALGWDNIEQRRAACEILGWDKVLSELEATVVDEDGDPEIGTLLEANFMGEKEKFLKVQCGTGRTFVLPVPPEMTTALEANSWTYGIDKIEFRPEIRT